MKKLILLSAFGILLGASCKKEDPSSIAYTVQCSKTDFNPPLILGADVSLPVDSAFTSVTEFDLNCDGINDFWLSIVEYTNPSSGKRVQIVHLRGFNGKLFFTNDSMGIGSTIYYTNFLAHTIPSITLAKNDETTGSFRPTFSKPYIPFMLALKGKRHYGWIKLQVTGTEPPLWQEHAHIIVEEFYVHPYAEEAVIIE